MPYIVIIIDELADIMSAYPSRTGISNRTSRANVSCCRYSLILSTQRPEVNVITGLIKANIPARIA